MRAQMPELMLGPAVMPEEARLHLAGCQGCAREWTELQATMAALDAWDAPEPSAYFDTRLAARLREEQTKAPARWWERLRARMMFTSNVTLRPAAAGVLAVLLTIGGGTALLVQQGTMPHGIPAESAAVHDLQVLDGNAQVYQQLNALDSDLDGAESPAGR